MVTKPSYSRQDRRAYQAAYRAAGRDSTRQGSRNLTLPFVGVDGEGGNLASGYHAYFLLRAGGRSIVPSGTNVRLTTLECLTLLEALPRDAIYVVYFGDYDVTKILEDLGWDKLEKLMDRSKRQRKDGKGVWPVSYGDFEVDYLPKKEFKVRRRKGTFIDPVTNKPRYEYTPWLVVNDVGSFFQCRFVEALEKWQIGTPEERALIGEGKAGRDAFQFSDIESIDPYNALEIELLQQLMEKFRAACKAVGYIPAKWQGPGQLAEAMLAKHGVALSRNVPLLNDEKYDDLIRFARNAFYGGRPEISAIGPVDRPVRQADINSAYPAAMLHVPCLEHGEWSYVEYPEPIRAQDIECDYGIFYGSYTHHVGRGKRTRWYGLPHRTKEGSICYPGSGRGWYWDFEISGAIHQDFRVESAWLYSRRCNCVPLRFVRDVYALRQELGKDDAGIVLKLALNSLYGKCVQSVGSPKYANPIWGSFITAYCRRMIQDFIHGSELCKSLGNCGLDILMIATDSVCTYNLERTDIEYSEDLGGWDAEEHPRGMFIVQPGLYFGSSNKRPKTRGVPRSVIETFEGTFRAAFDRMVSTQRITDGNVQVPQRMFVGIRYALHRHNLKLLGQWIEFHDPETDTYGKTISFDWRTKRDPYHVVNPMPGVHSYIETFPQDGDPTVETLPYSKDIGGLVLRQLLRSMYMDPQPDWVPQIEPGEMANAD